MPGTVLGVGCMSFLVPMTQTGKGDWQPQSLRWDQPSSKVVQTVAAWKRQKAKAVPGILKNLREKVAFQRISSPSAERPLKGHRSRGTCLASQTMNGGPRVEYTQGNKEDSDG